MWEIELCFWSPASPSPRALLLGARVAAATRQKERGSAKVKGGQHAAALRRYVRAVLLLRGAEGEPAAAAVAAAAHNNAALCQLKLGRHAAAAKSATAVLALEPDNGKALYRRGQARIELGQPVLALEDLRAAAKALPAQKSIQAALAAAAAAAKTAG